MRIHSSKGIFCSNVHFKTKPRKLIRKEGEPSFDVDPGFQKNGSST